MAFFEFEGEAKDSEHQQVHIGAINCAPPFSHQHVDLTVEIQSTETWWEDRTLRSTVTGY